MSGFNQIEASNLSILDTFDMEFHIETIFVAMTSVSWSEPLSNQIRASNLSILDTFDMEFHIKTIFVAKTSVS